MSPMVFDLPVREPKKTVLEAFCGVAGFCPLTQVGSCLSVGRMEECVLAEAVDIELISCTVESTVLHTHLAGIKWVLS